MMRIGLNHLPVRDAANRPKASDKFKFFGTGQVITDVPVADLTSPAVGFGSRTSTMMATGVREP